MRRLRVTKQGIPQGSPLSPVLANLFLDELDEAMLKAGQRFVRFCDDFLVLCKTPEKAAKAVKFTKDSLDRLHLKLDECDVVTFDGGFEFLGVLFCRSLIMVPFDRPKRERRVLFYPPPMNMDAYWLKKKRGW